MRQSIPGPADRGQQSSTSGPKYVSVRRIREPTSKDWVSPPTRYPDMGFFLVALSLGKQGRGYLEERSLNNNGGGPRAFPSGLSLQIPTPIARLDPRVASLTRLNPESSQTFQDGLTRLTPEVAERGEHPLSKKRTPLYVGHLT